MYTIGEAAARSGVPVATLRAWERRYAVIRPERTPSGYRLYDDEAIRRLSTMRRLVSSGWRPRQAAERVALGLGVDEPAAGADRADQAAPAEGLGSGDPVEGFAERFAVAASHLGVAALDRLLDEAFGRLTFEAAMETRIFPALRRVGAAWEAGTLDVAAEHAASETVRRRLAAIFDASADSGHLAPVVVGLGPGSRHELGALTFAVALRRHGVGVVYLGADVPVESWRAALDLAAASTAILAAVTASEASAAVEVVRALASDGVRVLLGGRAAASLTPRRGILLLPDSLAAAAAEVAGMLRVNGPAAAGG